MFRKLLRLSVAATLLVVFIFAAMRLAETWEPTKLEYSSTETQAVKIVSPPDMTGRWVTHGDDPTAMFAVIEEKTITVTLVSEGSHLVYWHGSFENPGSNGGTTVSNAIVADILVLSTASSKEFVCEEDALSFEITVMGMTKTMEMVRA